MVWRMESRVGDHQSMRLAAFCVTLSLIGGCKSTPETSPLTGASEVEQRPTSTGASEVEQRSTTGLALRQAESTNAQPIDGEDDADSINAETPAPNRPGAVPVGEMGSYGCENPGLRVLDGRAPRATGRPFARMSAAPEVSEGLSAVAVMRVVQRNLGPVAGCYADAPVGDPTATGAATLAWEILPTGAVANVRVVNSTFLDAATLQCVVCVVERFHFAATDTGQNVQVRVPVELWTTPD